VSPIGTAQLWFVKTRDILRADTIQSQKCVWDTVLVKHPPMTLNKKKTEKEEKENNNKNHVMSLFRRKEYRA
jgi:hypothetical protein